MFTNTQAPTKPMNNDNRMTVYVQMLASMMMMIGLRQREKLARLTDVTDDLPKAIEKILDPLLSLPAIEIEEESNDLEGEGRKIMIPSNIIDVWNRFEVLLGVKPSGHTNTLTYR